MEWNGRGMEEWMEWILNGMDEGRNGTGRTMDWKEGMEWTIRLFSIP